MGEGSVGLRLSPALSRRRAGRGDCGWVGRREPRESSRDPALAEGRSTANLGMRRF